MLDRITYHVAAEMGLTMGDAAGVARSHLQSRGEWPESIARAAIRALGKPSDAVIEKMNALPADTPWQDVLQKYFDVVLDTPTIL